MQLGDQEVKGDWIAGPLPSTFLRLSLPDLTK